jgi:hypothetical protein
MEMSHSALAIYYKAVQATPQIPLQSYDYAKIIKISQEKIKYKVVRESGETHFLASFLANIGYFSFSYFFLRGIGLYNTVLTKDRNKRRLNLQKRNLDNENKNFGFARYLNPDFDRMFRDDGKQTNGWRCNRCCSWWLSWFAIW